MLHIKCKKCGWRSPFSSKIDGYTVQSRLKKNGLICPKCGEILIESKRKWLNIIFISLVFKYKFTYNHLNLLKKLCKKKHILLSREMGWDKEISNKSSVPWKEEGH